MSLSTKIAELEKELLELNSRIDIQYHEKRRSSKQAYLNILRIRYNEVIIILKRIDKILKRKKDIQNLTKPLLNIEINDPEMLQIINEDFRINDELQVDLKSLYSWVYMIKEIFSNCKININLKELGRISHLRNHFITHITGSSMFKKSKNTQSGMKYNVNDGTVTILFGDIFDNTKFIGLKKLVKQVKPYIPELKNEKNMYEQTRILYEHIDKLHGHRLEGKAYELIKRIGIETEPPIKIADELLKSLKEYRKTKRI